MAILTSSQLTFVDITDQRQLSAYLTCNRTTVQIYDTDNSSYSPDWSQMNLVLTPLIFLDQVNIPLTGPESAGLRITWKRKDGNGSEAELASGESVSNKVLTVNANKLGATSSDMLTYICYIEYVDSTTSLTINISTQLSFTLIRTASDAKTCLITGSLVFKYDTSGVLVGDLQITLTGSLQHVDIGEWQYYNGTTYVPYPTTSDNTNITSATLNVKPTHEIFNSAGVARIKLTTSDNDVYDIISITKIYDGQRGQEGRPGGAGADAYTIYLTNESHTFAGTTDAAIEKNVETNVYAYKGSTEKSVKIITVDGIPATTTLTNTTVPGLQFEVSSTSEVTHPKITFYALTTLTAQSGVIPITMTIDGTTFTKNFSWSVARTGSGACSLSITSSSLIFKSTDGGLTYSPDSITLTPQFQNLSEQCTWTYSLNGGASNTFISITPVADVIAINSSTKALTVSKNWAAFNNNTSIVFQCTSTADSRCYDTMTIIKLSDGRDGADAAAAYTVILSNEVQNIPTDTSLKPLSATTYSCNVVVYEGVEKLNPTTGNLTNKTFKITPSNNPDGITIAQNIAGEITFSVNPNTAISESGEIKLTIDIKGSKGDTPSIPKSISYAVSKTGNAGVSPVTFSVYAPNGTVFYNQTGKLVLETVAYQGSTLITGSAYNWEKIGSTDAIEGNGHSTLEVNGDSVTNIATYKCTMTYGGKEYVGVITLEDKSDPYLSEMLTVGGTTFKNGQGGSFVYVKVRTNGQEVDPLYGPISTSQLVANTKDGYYYYVNPTNGICKLYKWNNSWVECNENLSLTYTWFLMDKDGNKDAKFAKTGKIIYLSCDDINGVGTLQCDVSKS